MSDRSLTDHEVAASLEQMIAKLRREAIRDQTGPDVSRPEDEPQDKEAPLDIVTWNIGAAMEGDGGEPFAPGRTERTDRHAPDDFWVRGEP